MTYGRDGETLLWNVTTSALRRVLDIVVRPGTDNVT